MKSISFVILVAFCCLGKADPIPEEDNYQKELRGLYSWTKIEFKPYGLALLNLTQRVGHSAVEHPRLFEGQDPAIIQPFVDKTKLILSNFDEAKKHVDSEDFMEKTIYAFQIASNPQWKHGLPESAVEHLELIRDESFKQSRKEIEAVFKKPSKEFYDKFLARLDETIEKLTPSEREAHPGLMRWRETNARPFMYFNQPWEFLFWAYNELNVTEPSKIE